MRFRKALISFGVAIALAVEAGLFSSRQAEAQSSRPYVVFVNGWQNCCAWDGMLSLENRLIEEMNAESRRVPYSTFRKGDRSNSTENDSAFLREGADFINNELERNRPLILIGHSFGGDSVLKLLPRINRRIQFVAVLDPVSTGGFRSSLSSVPGNVDYFFNRWQQNFPFPNDFKGSGSLQCSAKECDQVEQKFATDENFKAIRDKCGILETCKNKNRKTSHQGLPKDAGVKRWLGDRISEQLAAFKPIASAPLTRLKPGFYSRIGMNPPGIIYLWPSPWDKGKTDVWCDVPNHTMYANHINSVGAAIEVQDLESVRDTAKYWSIPCGDSVFNHSRIQN